MGKHLVVFPHGADLDLVGAARIIQLQHPELLVVQPRRLNANAWDIIRRRGLFRFSDPGNIVWKEVTHVHLLGIQASRQNPEIILRLSGFAGEIFAYLWMAPALPFRVVVQHITCQALTAWLLGRLPSSLPEFLPSDSLLFRMALFEKTQGFLSARTTPGDWQALRCLGDARHQARQVSNQICLGLREGQHGLLNDLLKRARDIDINHIPAVLAVSKTIGNVQDIFPVVEHLWSRLDPFLLISGVINFGRAQVWVRHRIPHLDVVAALLEFHPRQERQWVTFSVAEGDPGRLAETLRTHLVQRLSGEPTARAIMVAPPQTVCLNETVRGTLDFMLKFNLMGLVVVTAEGRYAGVIARRDLDRAVRMEFMAAEIAPFVNADCPTISPEMPVRVIKHLMVNRNITRLPVVRDGNVLGIITSREVLRALPTDLPLPRRYLPITRTRRLPSAEEIIETVKRIISVKILHWWKRIGERAQTMGLKAYLVGGVVRDLLLERANLDMDIVVSGDAIPFATAVAEELHGTVRVFDRFHTARVSLDDVKIDFSSARIEHYERAGALPEVEFSGLTNDLFRRDFSINALALDLSPNSFMCLNDFFGGYEDIQERKIRILHSFSFLEDPTRIYRAHRFAGRFHFHFAEETQRALEVAQERHIIERLSTQRLCGELSRCFGEEQPAGLLQRLLDADLLRYLHEGFTPQTPLPVRYRLIPSMVRRFQVLGEPVEREVLYWAGLLSMLPPAQARDILAVSGFPARKREKVAVILDALATIPSQLNAIAPAQVFEVYCLLKPQPLEALIGLALFGLDKNGARRLFEFLGRYRAIQCEISGKDLRDFGIEAGPQYGRILTDVLRRRVMGELRDRKDELEYVRRTYAGL